MKYLYVIGNPVKNSLSPPMQNAALKRLGLDNEYTFDRMKVSVKDLRIFVEKVRKGKIAGASVTLPNKEAIISFLDELTEEAELCQSVNTVYIKNGKIIGHNTDGAGFIKAFESTGVSLADKKIVLLGAGGAAKAIAFTLALRDVKKLIIVNRTIQKAEVLVDDIKDKTNANVSSCGLDLLRDSLKDADILINATSIGMKGKTENQTLVTADIIPSKLIVMDIVYIPKKTRLLKEAEKAGAKIIEGFEMLIYQGAKQFELFTGRNAPTEDMRETLLVTLDEIGGKKN